MLDHDGPENGWDLFELTFRHQLDASESQNVVEVLACLLIIRIASFSEEFYDDSLVLILKAVRRGSLSEFVRQHIDGLVRDLLERGYLLKNTSALVGKDH